MATDGDGHIVTLKDAYIEAYGNAPAVGRKIGLKMKHVGSNGVASAEVKVLARIVA